VHSAITAQQTILVTIISGLLSKDADDGRGVGSRRAVARETGKEPAAPASAGAWQEQTDTVRCFRG